MTSSDLALALAATTVSQSKLGVEVLGDDATSQTLLAACPALVVFPVPANPAASAQIAAYHLNCTGGIAIVSVGDKGLAVAGAATATSLVPGWLAQIAGLADKPDAVEGPSEPTGAATALADFWSS